MFYDSSFDMFGDFINTILDIFANHTNVEFSSNDVMSVGGIIVFSTILSLVLHWATEKRV